MGKEQSKDRGYGPKNTYYVLKVGIHCECTGCVKKIAEGIKEISLSEGVERADLVAETGEVHVVGTMNPERFCCLLHEATKKSVAVKIVLGVNRDNLSDRGTATSQHSTKKLFAQQAPSSDWSSSREEEASLSSGWRNGVVVGSTVTPSAPPLPEDDWSETERCWYRWPAPASSSSMPLVWAASDVTATLAMYEL